MRNSETRYPTVHVQERSKFNSATTKCGFKNATRKRGDPNNAARERNRVRTLRNAFAKLQHILPSVPPDTKLSKLDILILATTYIRHLSKKVYPMEGRTCCGCNETTFWSPSDCKKFDETMMHPVKKWPMRSVFYSDMTENKRHGTDGNDIASDVLQRAAKDFDVTNNAKENASKEIRLHEIFPDLFDS